MIDRTWPWPASYRLSGSRGHPACELVQAQGSQLLLRQDRIVEGYGALVEQKLVPQRRQHTLPTHDGPEIPVSLTETEGAYKYCDAGDCLLIGLEPAGENGH